MATVTRPATSIESVNVPVSAPENQEAAAVAPVRQRSFESEPHAGDWFALWFFLACFFLMGAYLLFQTFGR